MRENLMDSASVELLKEELVNMEEENQVLSLNPHFLFNTLNCIAKTAYFEGAGTTEEVIYCFSELMRYNLKQKHKRHLLATEIENIEKYLYIQKMRLKKYLTWEINILDELISYNIPNLTLQPIVENAIVHGISAKEEGGRIRINAEARPDKICIYIEDDGVGFPQETLQLLRNGHGERKGEHLGLNTTDKRLKRCYGSEYGIQILHTGPQGSKVAVTIPYDVK